MWNNVLSVDIMHPLMNFVYKLVYMADSQKMSKFMYLRFFLKKKSLIMTGNDIIKISTMLWIKEVILKEYISRHFREKIAWTTEKMKK